MNFHAVATEIMLTANEEKWQETRAKIEAALESVVKEYRPMWHLGPVCDCAPGQFCLDPYRPNSWRDQPDGVR